jgi:hypothetical protein
MCTSCTLKVAALREWAERREAELGRPVTVWMDALCPDATPAALSALQRMPVFLAKCSKLLILCGPTLIDQLWCATELFCWRATGGKQLDVEVALVAPAGESEALTRIIASFDAFHVMYCVAQRADEQARMEYAVELATISRFNDRVRWFYPIVQEAVRAHRERARDEPSALGRISRSFTMPTERKLGDEASELPASAAREQAERARRASSGNDDAIAAQRRVLGPTTGEMQLQESVLE